MVRTGLERRLYVGKARDLGIVLTLVTSDKACKQWRQMGQRLSLSHLILADADATMLAELQCRVIARYSPELNLHF